MIPSSRRAAQAAAEPHGTPTWVIWLAVLGCLFGMFMLLCCGAYVLVSLGIT